MRPSNEQIASGKSHDYSREKGYVESEYQHQDYPKHVDGVLMKDEAEHKAHEARKAEAAKAAEAKEEKAAE